MLEADRLVSPTHPIAVPRQSFEIRTRRETWITLLIALAHIPLGLFLYNAGQLAILHPVLVFLLGMYLALRKQYGLERVSLAVGYLVGVEVLWRMAKVPIYWEFGKYGIAAIMITALIMRRQYKVPLLPLIFGLLLTPACFLTFTVFDPETARGHVSANISGPLALVVSCWFFSKIQLSALQLQRLFYSVMIPLLSVASATLFYAVTIENLQFTTESNFATSGGFGPNQVSSMLGLGFFICASYIILFRNGRMLTLVLGILALFFSAQSIMTFSRGGIFNALGALGVLVIFHFRDLVDGLKRIVPLLVLVILFFWLVFPQLNSFTGGKLQERFEETDTTNRVDIVQSDLEIFLENPILGVGVGVASSYRERFLEYSAASHTESARLISEHGSLGLMALGVLIAMVVVNIKRRRGILRRALVAGLAMWCFLYMSNAGMRLAAPSFLWGLTFVTIGERRPNQRRIFRQIGSRSLPGFRLP